MNHDLCKHCTHYFEPIVTHIDVWKIRDILLNCSSETVWVIWHGQRYPVRSFYKVSYSWSLWAEDYNPMTLSGMCAELRKHKNWEGLHDNGCHVRIVEPDVRGWIYRIEETRTMPNLEDGGETEDITGEVLIYVHTEEDVELAWEVLS